MLISPFQPKYGSTLIVTPGIASAASSIDAQSKQVSLINTGGNIAYVRIYSSLTTPAPTASTADYPIASGSGTVISKGDGEDRIAYISAIGTTLQITVGEGF